MKTKCIDPEQFVRAWMDGKTGPEIAALLGCHPTYVSQYATQLRKQGVDLPARRTRKALVDVTDLNRIIAEKARRP